MIVFKQPDAYAYSEPVLASLQTFLFATTVGSGLFEPKSLNEPSDLISIANKSLPTMFGEAVPFTSTNK